MVSTKRSMADALRALCEKKPLNKVTVSDITAQCGISRMTFYYHYHDIFDLLDWVCRDDVSVFSQRLQKAQGAQACLEALYGFMKDKEPFVSGLYKNGGEALAQRYLPRLINALIDALLSGDGCPSDEKGAFLSGLPRAFYRHALVGVTIDWVAAGMTPGAQDMAREVASLIRCDRT